MGGGLSVLLVEDTEDTGSDLVVDDGLVIFADNVDAELDDVVGLQFEWFGFQAFTTKPFPVYERTI
jgi:hypothetical protein